MLYFLRHDIPGKEDQGRMLGLLDVSIEDHGKFSLEHPVLPVDGVICSSLRRTQQTATLLGYPSEIIEVDDRIIEFDLGTYTDKIPSKEDFLKINRMDEVPNDTSHQGESFNSFRLRVVAFFIEVRRRSEKEDILVITHSGVLRFLFTRYLDLLPNNYHPSNLEMIQYHPHINQLERQLLTS